MFICTGYDEINEFACAILEVRPPVKGTLEHAGQCTRIFEAFVQGSGKRIGF